ncbi:NUDIX domain-containing protein [Candidatus Methanomassiliicoccus intestinalis]|uniref:NUDIX domain-containing protein n=1 Tax=Candidatus Methanomassiliicoccus intestinalis TaxID=1406512 RepID=UPI0037DC1D27
MYTPEPVIRLKKGNQIILSAEEAERLLDLRNGISSKVDDLPQYTTPDGSSLNFEGNEILNEYLEKSRYFKDFFSAAYRNPTPTVDGIITAFGKIVLIQRKKEPFKGCYALPGGFVEYGETAEEAVVREILEETGLETEIIDLVGVFSSPDRDPRRHTMSVAYSLRVLGGTLCSGDDAANADYFPLDNLPHLAFDHDQMIEKWKKSSSNH